MAKQKNGLEPTPASPCSPEALTKFQAVERALAELGQDAKPSTIQGFVKNRFGIEMSASHISAAKGMIRRKRVIMSRPLEHPAPVAATPTPAKGKASYEP
jgi:hypothetical protein